MMTLTSYWISKAKTAIKFIDLKWGGGRRKPEDYDGLNVLYIDNKFENFFDQIRIFFESGFLNSSNTIVVFKFYRENYFHLIKGLALYNVISVPYLFHRQMPNISKKFVFYPYNSQSNARLILNRDATHIFLTHGESNKKASVNRMTRLYDYVLAAGDISVERYLESGVFTQYDISMGKVIRVGDIFSAKCVEYSVVGGEPAIIYMPTWEGGLEDENFSSLSSPLLTQTILKILKSLSINKIILKIHPNTGSRVKKYKFIVNSFCFEILRRKIDLYIDPDSEKFSIFDKKVLSQAKSCADHLNVVAGVVDISAAEFMLAAKRIPSIVFGKKIDKCFASSSYWGLRKKSFVNTVDMINIDEAIDELDNVLVFDNFCKKSFNREDYLVNKTPETIYDTLISKWSNSK